MAVDVLFETDHRLVAVARCGAAAFAGQSRELPKHRRGFGSAGAERGTIDQSLAGPQQLKALLGEDFMQAFHLVACGLLGFEEDVSHDKAWVVHDLGVEPVAGQPPAPLRARDVDQQSAAVTFAVDASGAVHHQLEPHQGVLDHASVGLSVARDERGERAGVVLDQIGKPMRRHGGKRRRRHCHTRPLGVSWYVRRMSCVSTAHTFGGMTH